MKKINKIAIIGVGLIGGSIGLALKNRHLAKEVIGVFRRSSTLKKALICKAVDKGTMNIEDGIKDADLIILASPVYKIPALAAEAAKYAKKGAIITDTGSTKAWIVKEIERIIRRRPSLFFVGSHPMAGSERQGVESARSDLVNGAPCIVTKTKNTDARALKKVINLWKALGANVKVMDPARHDRAVSLVSHLPHIVAFSLAGAVPEKMLEYAAEGFRDTTRVASSDPKLWADIFLTNKREIRKAGKMFERYYSGVMKSILKGDYPGTVGLLKSAKSKRDRFIYGKKA